MSRPILSGQLAKWALLLFEFEINFIVQRAIKGQALANFLADHPVPTEWELTEEFLDEEIFLVEILPPWKMCFDGVARRNGAGAGVLFVSPKDDLLPSSFVHTQNCSNNVAEYQAPLLGLCMAITGEFEVKKIELVPFWEHAGKLLAKITQTSLHYIPRTKNGPADALAGIAASLAQFDNRPSQVPICKKWVVPLVHLPIEEEAEEKMEQEEESLPISIHESEATDWREPISNFLRHDTLPADLRERVHIRWMAPRYVFVNDVKRLGYYWPSMLRDAIVLERACKAYQVHADYIHQPLEPLHPTVAS
ncbi:hypothetical protein H6P81_007216 [Aristolochia fimbriata]|uniref:RNase H type-1 domain-containing protein n=1 Tax=Aristolochia fimbriata TaxID=158543 RepID=A0AAV7EZQ2_ARIFI|nr:hypothetical protein H6P81_007216 [Aristolochia fimbriata]